VADFEQMRLAWGDEWASVMERFYPLLVEKAFGDAGIALGMSLAFTLDNPLIQEILGELAQQVRGVADTTIDEIQALVGRQAAEGWSVDQLAAEIGKLAEIRSTERARVIAVTETASAYSRGSIAAYQQSGVVDRLTWLTTDPCEICQENNEKIVPMGEAFPSGHTFPPAHPNCRCAISPVLSEA
jgi:SPP1 gp7 family putative phage head morphogenesis protein